jgi:hypothetical protein
MFVSEVLEGDETRLTDGIVTRFPRLELFRTRGFRGGQASVPAAGRCAAPEEFIEQLGREHAVKPDVRHARPMGFVR